MPIASKSLTKLANREDIGSGVKRWRVEGVDAKGRNYVHGPFSGTQAEADAILAGVTWELTAVDKSDLLAWVIDKNPVSTFDYTDRDITELQGEEYIFQWFAESSGDEAIKVAWWLDSLNTGAFNTIRDRIGYTGEQGANITSRFTFMMSVEPWYELTETAP
jgi:hypothetical protein